MEEADIQPLIEDLTSNVDDLEQALAPLLNTALSHSTSKLPLLDKAKLYVLATYAIESILFSSLRLNGVDAKTHPVFQELARVKGYFAKIKSAETSGTKRNVTLNKDAATRFIKHGLAGNEKYDRERAERVATEKAGAKRKLEEMSVGTHTRLDGSAKRSKAAEGHDDSQHTTNGVAQLGEAPSMGMHTKFTDSEKIAHTNEQASEEEAYGDSSASRPKPKSSNEALASLLDNAESTSDQQHTKKKKRRKKKHDQRELEDLRAEETK
jgi:exosome complex protein LRP1